MTQIDRFHGAAPTIRFAAPTDAARLAELCARLFEQTYAAVNTREDMSAHLAGAFSESLQHHELTNPQYATWIAEDASGEAVGYLMMRIGSRAPGIAFARPVEVYRLYVDRPWHGRGVGDLLMNAGLAHATALTADGIWLGVWEKNPRAIAFYTRVGYVVVGQTTYTLGSDEQNDLVMARSLNERAV